MANTLETLAVYGIGFLLLNKVADSLADVTKQLKAAPSNAANSAKNAVEGIPAAQLAAAGVSPDQYLNVAIDEWFAGANGYLFGAFGSYDPTNWNAFAAANQNRIFGMPGNNPPAQATAYFNSLSLQYWNATGGVNSPTSGLFS